MRMLRFFTDSNTEIPWKYAEENDIGLIKMPYILDGEEYYYDLGKATDFTMFFGKMRQGILPTTAALNPELYYEIFKPVLAAGDDIIKLHFSHKLSNTHESMHAAIARLKEEFPERTVYTVDTLSISMGAGIIVMEAVKRWKQGATGQEIVRLVEDMRQSSNAWFVVDDLMHLRRGGRLSTTSAVAGTVLGVKPILTINSEGKVVLHEKVQGRKKGIKTLIDKFSQQVLNPLEQENITVLHADCEDDAQAVATEMKTRFVGLNVTVQNVGPVIGTHAGPGTLGVVFFGKPRPVAF